MLDDTAQSKSCTSVIDDDQGVESRSAVDIAAAANAAIDIAMIAVEFLPGGPVATKVAKGARKFAPAAKAVAKKLPDVAPVVAQLADKAQEKMPDVAAAGADRVKDSVRGAAGHLSEKGRAAGDKVRDAIEEREREKMLKAARRALLDGAGNKLTVEQFRQNWSLQVTPMGIMGDGYMAFSGCYAIATYPSAVKRGDFGQFKGIYIGKSENMGQSIYNDLIGLGNVDVYADVKYKQHVYILLYPCPAEKIDELESSLIAALDADASYNGPKRTWEATVEERH